MATFQAVQKNNDIKKTIKETFDVDLSISGDWGYTEQQATVIESIENSTPPAQLQHMLTTIRAHLEMNITQEQDNRYGGINVNELSREESRKDRLIYNKVTYIVTGIKEDLYKTFIKEYKEGYETEMFDLNEHFKKRKAATISREVVYHFEVSHIN